MAAYRPTAQHARADRDRGGLAGGGPADAPGRLLRPRPEEHRPGPGALPPTPPAEGPGRSAPCLVPRLVVGVLADVQLRERGRGGGGAEDAAQPGRSRRPPGTGRRTTAPWQQLGEPLRELLVVPHPPQTGLRVAAQAAVVALAELRDERVAEQQRVVQGEVHALRGDRRDEVGRVAGEEQPAVRHRLDDVVVHVEHPLLDQPALGERRGPGRPQPVVQLGPDPVVRPVLRVVARRALEVVAGDLGAAGHVAGEAARMDAEDHAVGGRRRLGEQRQPADRRSRAGRRGRAPAAARRGVTPRAPSQPAMNSQSIRMRVRPSPGRCTTPTGRSVSMSCSSTSRTPNRMSPPAHVRVLPHQVRHQQRLRIDEVMVPGQLGVPEPVALAVEAELALACAAAPAPAAGPASPRCSRARVPPTPR